MFNSFSLISFQPLLVIRLSWLRSLSFLSFPFFFFVSSASPKSWLRPHFCPVPTVQTILTVADKVQCHGQECGGGGSCVFSLLSLWGKKSLRSRRGDRMSESISEAPGEVIYKLHLFRCRNLLIFSVVYRCKWNIWDLSRHLSRVLKFPGWNDESLRDLEIRSASNSWVQVKVVLLLYLDKFLNSVVEGRRAASSACSRPKAL